MTNSNTWNWRRIAGIGAVVALIGLSLSVNLFPNINNDGVDYIGYSRNLGQQGLVQFGYRQIGYPLILALGRALAGSFGIEGLLFSALTQRLLLALGVGYAIWLWRWKALPVAVLVLTPSFLAYTNFLLTEAVTIPLALLLGCLVAHHFAIATRRDRVPSDREPWQGFSERRLAIATAWMATAIAFLLLTIRFPFVVFGIVPVMCWIAARRRRVSSLPYGVSLSVFVIAVGLFSLGMARENSQELGVFTPTARGERSAYWSAWQLTFTLHPENRTDPRLTDYYDDGSPYFRIWDIEDEQPSYPDQAAELNRSISEMLSAADMSVPRERLFSFFGALRGGRIDDVKPRLEMILATDASNVDSVIHSDDVSRKQGWGVFNDRYNNGAKPQAVITSPVFPSPPVPYVTTLLPVLLPIALVGSLAFAVFKRKVLVAITYLAPTLVYSAAVAWLLADNARFLMTTTIYAVAGFSALWAVADRGDALRYRLGEHHAIDQT